MHRVGCNTGKPGVLGSRSGDRIHRSEKPFPDQNPSGWERKMRFSDYGKHAKSCKLYHEGTAVCRTILETDREESTCIVLNSGAGKNSTQCLTRRQCGINS